MVMKDGSPFLRNTYVLCRQTYASLPQVRLFLDALKKTLTKKRVTWSALQMICSFLIDTFSHLLYNRNT